MIQEMRGTVGLFVAGLAVLLGACGSASNGAGTGGSGASGTGAGSSSSTTLHCCINSSAYECPSKSAFDKCAGGDPQACFTQCGSDPVCLGQCMSMLGNNDPSACTKVNEPVSTYCGSTGTGTGSSSGSTPAGCDGQACTYDADCPNGQSCDTATGHCFDQNANCVGNACMYDADCPNGEGCDSATSTCFAK